MSKYIIDVGDAYAEYICGKGDMLCLPVRINEFEDNWLNTNIPLIPYTEPDTEKVREEAYEQGLSDAKEGKATCQYCEYQYLDDTEEPCKRCCKAYMNKYKPKAKEEQIQVGDEVKSGDEKYIVLQKYLNNIDELMVDLFNRRTGEIDKWHLYNANGAIFEKTGRHFPEIAAVLAKMKEDNNG